MKQESIVKQENPFKLEALFLMLLNSSDVKSNKDNIFDETLKTVDITNVASIISFFESMYNPINIEGMARYGICPEKNYGISVTNIRKIAKKIKSNQLLVNDLWETGIHEARILACLIADPEKISSDDMDYWAQGFDSWDICDLYCIHLFRKTKYAKEKILLWAESDSVFVKRSAFSLIATIAVHEEKLKNEDFDRWLQMIEKFSNDSRNYVKKAVSWALRQIGKRNLLLHSKALATAESLSNSKVASTRWIGNDAKRELSDEKTIDRVMSKSVTKTKKKSY